MKPGETFKCMGCGKKFLAAREEADALAEMHKIYGDLPEGERAIVCDDCFNQIRAKERAVH